MQPRLGAEALPECAAVGPNYLEARKAAQAAEFSRGARCVERLSSARMKMLRPLVDLLWFGLFSLAFLVGTASAAIETDGALDQAFDAGTFTNGLILAAVLQPDGKLLIGGAFGKVHGVARTGIARLQADGTLDSSFDPGAGPDFGVTGIIVQPDGKIIIFGSFTTVSGISRAASIARLNSDGSLDTAFNPGRVISYDGLDDGSGNATSPGYVNSVVLQPDGKLVVVGNFFYVITAPSTSVARSCVARFNSDGTFDPSYNPGTGVRLLSGSVGLIYAVRQGLGANSGKIIIAGPFDGFDGNTVGGLARLNTDGSFDGTFTPGTGGLFDSNVRGLVVQSDDQLIVFGNFVSFSGGKSTGIVRLDITGVVDGGFSPEAFADYASPSSVYSVAIQPNGKLIVGGSFHSLGGAVANNIVRLETNGARDTSFDSTLGTGPSGFGVDVVLVRPSDGKVFVGGNFSTYGGALRNNIAWANNDGSVDAVFAGLSGAIDAAPRVYALVTQPDGKILVGGAFSSFNGASHYNLVRLNPDLSIDPSFDPTLGTEGSVRTILLQPDGRIVIGGTVNAVNGVPRRRIARLNTDGTLDTSFDPGSGADSTIYALAQDSAGNIYAGGAFQFFNGISRRRVAKLTSTGTVDAAFNPNVSSTVRALAPPDGSGGIVIGGLFSRRIARLSTTTGAIDTGFNVGVNGFNGQVFALLRTPGGQYYAGGSFTTFNGTQRSGVARLNDNGSLDTTFVGPALVGNVNALALQNGKVLMAQDFSAAPSQVVRLTSSGASDSTFTGGIGASISPPTAYPGNLNFPAISTLAIQPDGKLLIGGIFNQYNGTSRACLARLTDSKLNFTAVSRKVHGTSGPAFDVNLPLTGAPGIECRSDGANGNYQVVFNFAGSVTLGNAAVTAGAGTVTGATGSGTSNLTVNLTGVANAQRITLTLSNVSTGISTTDLAVPIGFLVGDTNGNGFVNTGDALETRNRSGQATAATNFRSDVNADGIVNSGDTIVVRSRSGTSLP